MAGRTKRAHDNGLKLAEIADWGITEPKIKRTNTRKAIIVDPEEMEMRNWAKVPHTSLNPINSL